MAIKKGKLNVGINFLGVFIKSKPLAQLFTPVWQVTVEGKRYPLNRDLIRYADKELLKIIDRTGGRVGVITNNDGVVVIRLVDGTEIPILITCYVPPVDKSFKDKVSINTQKYMIETLIEDEVVDAQTAEELRSWL